MGGNAGRGDGSRKGSGWRGDRQEVMLENMQRKNKKAGMCGEKGRKCKRHVRVVKRHFWRNNVVD